MPWPTFWLEPTGVDRVALRRYSHTAVTEAEVFHSAVRWLDLEIPSRFTGCLDLPTFPADDERWPAVCAECSYVFGEDDERQVWSEPVFMVPASGELRVLHTQLHPPDIEPAGPGASWHGWWLPARWWGQDGMSLMVRCPRNDGAGPGSDWPVDMPSTGSGGMWTRGGDPREGRVTAYPSISIGVVGEPGSYHGWLQDGVLSDPI